MSRCELAAVLLLLAHRTALCWPSMAGENQLPDRARNETNNSFCLAHRSDTAVIARVLH